MATFSSSSQVVNFSLGLLFKLPSLFSSESIFSQFLNDDTLTFLSANNWRRPSLPGLGMLDVDANNPCSRSSDMLATCHGITTNYQNQPSRYIISYSCTSNFRVSIGKSHFMYHWWRTQSQYLKFKSTLPVQGKRNYLRFLQHSKGL